jgi:uncharacterized caspase-like protein
LTDTLKINISNPHKSFFCFLARKMCPVSLSTSRSARNLETGQAKLWMLLVGVNHYQDEYLPSLQYSALDCQGLGEALAQATQGFPNKEIIIHHDEAEQIPTLDTVRTSLKQIVAAAKPSDIVLFYFSGHGIIEPDTQQAVLCLTNTQKDNLLTTGLGVQELLQLLRNCAARQQQIWLDACHSGGMTLGGAKGETEIQTEENDSSSLLNPTFKLVEVLRKRAAQSKGFYALLSCDQGQRSWEFPELGHGLFTYYLMRGLQGEAADSDGVIEADGLYRYVYHQTLRYIEKTNEQLRLINQQKRSRGELYLHPEYPLQTPKRIVEGIGELILGLKPDRLSSQPVRQGLVVEELAGSQVSLSPEQDSRLQEILWEFVGPIAPALLQQVLVKVPTSRDLVEKLALHLPLHQRVEFEKKAEFLIPEPAVQAQMKSGKSPTLKTQVVNESSLGQCERTLAEIIGPIATFLVQKAWMSHPQASLEELVEILAAEIPDAQKALEFKNRIIF